MKGKPLLPVLRTKKRYIVYETISEENISHTELFKAIKDSFRHYFGAFELGLSGLADTRISAKNKGILKVNNKYLDKLKTAIVLVKDINKKKAIIRVTRVSGMMQKAKSELKGG